MARFSVALDHLMDGGLSISRSDWNGKGMVVRLHTPNYEVEPHLIIYNGNTGKANSWVPSSSDLLADTWEVQGDVPKKIEEVSLDLTYEKTFDVSKPFADIYSVRTRFRDKDYLTHSDDSLEAAVKELVDSIEKEHGVLVRSVTGISR